MKGGQNMYKKVLVPLDGSELAECALDHVKKLIKEGSVKEMTLLNVVKVDIPWAIALDKGTNINAIREFPFFEDGGDDRIHKEEIWRRTGR
jgi:nucleotide-binding universal stress UspA family protein